MGERRANGARQVPLPDYGHRVPRRCVAGTEDDPVEASISRVDRLHEACAVAPQEKVIREAAPKWAGPVCPHGAL